MFHQARSNKTQRDPRITVSIARVSAATRQFAKAMDENASRKLWD
jgi:hypothetical protein